jgi:hypothetical protein
MKYLPVAQFIVLVLILISLNGSLIASGYDRIASLFDAKPAPSKAEAPRKRKPV